MRNRLRLSSTYKVELPLAIPNPQLVLGQTHPQLSAICAVFTGRTRVPI